MAALTAREFLANYGLSAAFRHCCDNAVKDNGQTGIEPTPRQVRKFRQRRGLAYQAFLKTINAGNGKA